MLSPYALHTADSAAEPIATIRPRSSGCRAPVSAEQLRSWREMIGNEKASLRGCVSSVRVLGALDPSLLRESVQILVGRHEALRTRIAADNSIPHQLIDAATQNCFESVNVQSSADRDSLAAVARLAQAFADEEILLSVGPLFKVMLFRVSRDDHVLVVMLDHMVSDAVSWQILNGELWTIYDQIRRREPLKLAALDVQYADYAAAQARSYATWSRAHQAYWIQRLANAPGMHGPPDPRLSVAPAGMMLHFPLGKALTGKLRAAAERTQASLPIIALCLYFAAVSRWRDIEDVVIAFISHGRYGRPELQNIVGFLTTSLHLRVKVARNCSLHELLRTVQEELSGAYRHQDFGQVVHFLPQYTAELFFNWVPSSWAGMTLKAPSDSSPHLRRQPFPLRIVRPTRFFYGFFYEGPAGIGCTFYFNQHSVPAESVHHLAAILRGAAEDFVPESST